ncbi:hypothetical protein [Vagococcus sp. WN89Y]|uniref:hypothetical protein n=1 Tax=Vagococcus sp. WN89Y TaxID=3457258 RepID=UPI003FCCFE18
MPSISGFSSSRVLPNNDTAVHAKTQSGNAATNFIRKNILAVSNSPAENTRVKNAQSRVDTHWAKDGSAQNKSEVKGLNAYIQLANGEIFPASARLSISPESTQRI